MKKNTAFKIFSHIAVFSILILPMFVFAADIPGTPSPSGSLNPLGKTGTLAAFIGNILKVVIEIAIPIAALAIVYIGFLFVTAKGNPGDLNKAKDALMWTLVGLAILLGASAIVGIISTTVTGLGN